MNTKFLILIITLLLSAFALVGCGLQNAQAETDIGKIEKRIEGRSYSQVTPVKRRRSPRLRPDRRGRGEGRN